MTIQEIQQEIIDEFSLFDDWMQRYEYMIELGKSLPLIAPEFKTDDHIIKGCQSKVWVHAALEGDQLSFTADSDAIITKGNYRHFDSRFFQSTPKRYSRCRHRFYRSNWFKRTFVAHPGQRLGLYD